MPMIHGIMEGIFDLFYLSFAVYAGLTMLLKGKSPYVRLFGLMSLTLASGDSFHLIPRVIALLTTGLNDYKISLGLGKLITSVTMTFFYLLLYFSIELRTQTKSQFLRILCIGLTIIRVILCLFPQNDWFSRTPPVSWGYYRNIPFLVLGILIVSICLYHAIHSKDYSFLQLAIAISLSFSFYVPVVVAVHLNPKLGMLMIPKTLCYVWIIIITLRIYQKERKEGLPQKLQNTHQSHSRATPAASDSKRSTEKKD